ncbi:hypothetical protein ACDH46_01025 [Aerococcaceae bacterium zg-1292]
MIYYGGSMELGSVSGTFVFGILAWFFYRLNAPFIYIPCGIMTSGYVLTLILQIQYFFIVRKQRRQEQKLLKLKK